MFITKQELVKLFITYLYPTFIKGNKIEPIRFIFQDDIYDLLSNDKISIDYIKKNNVINEDEIYIKIPNADLFFTKLTIVTNLYCRLNNIYDESSNKDYIINEFLQSALWLKMNPYDFYDIYTFLDNQISFLLCPSFKELDPSKGGYHFGEYHDYHIYVMKDINTMWFESYEYITFKLFNIDDYTKNYELPSIHYGIADNICYIYAIQNMALNKQDKKIERSLYKINKDIQNNNIHPSFILSMKLFIDLLKEKGISNIKVPLLQVLNYNYHVIKSNQMKEEFKREWTDEYIKSIENAEDEFNNYKEALALYNRYVDREDDISKNKTEVFASIFLRIQEQFNNIDIDIDDYMLNIKIKDKVLTK